MISKEVLDLKDYVVETRRYFHKNPEVSLKEYKTSAFIKGELDNLGIEYVNVGETGILATIKGKHEGPTVFLRADMDALPLQDKIEKDYRSVNEGVSHGCGHDAHVAGLLATSKIIAKRKDEIKGTVKLCFQAAEEIGRGAKEFVKAGHLKDVDYAFGIHVASALPVGKVAIVPGAINASCDIFKIHVKGESAHGSRPDLGKDALLAAASIAVELQNIVSRRVSPLDSVVLTLGKLNAGTAYNIIANDGYIEGTLRTLDQNIREKILKKIELISKNIAEVHDCEAEFENYNAASILQNDEQLTEEVQIIAKKILGTENVITAGKPSLGAEDFSEFTNLVKGTFINVGTSSCDATSYPHHHENFDLDEEGILYGVELFKNILENYSLKENKIDLEKFGTNKKSKNKNKSLAGLW